MANTGKIELPSFFGSAIEQRRVIAGNRKEERGTMLLDDPVNVSRNRRAGVEDGRRANTEWEVQRVSQPICEEELGHAEASIGPGYSEDLLGIQLGADHHIVLQMNAAFRVAGAAGRVEPKCRSIRPGGFWLKARRRLRHQLRQGMHPVRRLADNCNMPQMR